MDPRADAIAGDDIALQIHDADVARNSIQTPRTTLEATSLSRRPSAAQLRATAGPGLGEHDTIVVEHLPDAPPPASSRSFPLFRQLSTHVMSIGQVSTYYCCICMERNPSDAGFTLQCGHTYCKACLKEWAKNKISEKNVFLKCFADTSSAQQTDATTGSGQMIPADPGSGHSTAAAAGAPSATLAANRAVAAVAGHQAAQQPANTATAALAAMSRGRQRLVCDTNLSDSEILQLLGDDAATIEKYHRFKAVSRNPNLRECPFCNISSEGTAEQPQMVCSNAACGKEFCFLHSNAHVGKTCAQYDREHIEEEKLNEAAMSTDSKPCPKCGIRISKSAGCNHMKCPACAASFCWLCGRAVDASELPLHFQWWNIAGCPNQQFADRHPSIRSRAMTAATFVFLGIPSMVITAACYLACCCVCVPAGINYPDGGTVAYFLT